MGKKKSDITPEERALFKNALKGTHRLPQPNLLINNELPKNLPRVNPVEIDTKIQWVGSYELYLQNLAPEEWLQPEDTIHFAKTGVQARTLTKLKKGQLGIEARLDLHQLTADQSLDSAGQFIDRCFNNGARVILIVHGKGQFTHKPGPVLKNLLARWLREHPHVLAFSSCKPRDGGGGALYVLLKSNRTL